VTPLPQSDRMPGRDGIVRCTVGSEHYAFRSDDVRHIARVEQMRAEAGAGGHVGSLKMAGQIVPVFSLGRVLSRADDDARAPGSAGQHIAVTGQPNELVGWLVDRIARTPLSASSDVVALPDTVGAPATRWFEAVVKAGDDSLLLLAPQHLNPVAPVAARRDVTPAFHDAPRRTDNRAEPMALIFSSTALPACDARRYALSGRQVAAIVQPAPAITVPGSAAHVAGVMWWRHAVVPVIDFRDAGDRRQAAHGRCLIAQCGARLHGTLVAFSIEPEVALHRPEADNHVLPELNLPLHALGMFDVSGESVALLDLDALLLREAGVGLITP
jgi:chemotaxis signal transduction protein